MGRGRSKKVIQIKEELIEKIAEGHRRPGNWFISNRELASRYSISYQTAHRLISELCEEGYLHRTPSSGTYVASEEKPPEGIALIFHEQTRLEADGYGDILCRKFEERLQADKISYEIVIANHFTEYPPGRFCIIWGGRYDLHEIIRDVHYSVLIDQKPMPGLNSVFTDSICVDLYSAGAGIAQLFNRHTQLKRTALLMGEENHWQALLDGFSAYRKPTAIRYAGEWTHEAHLEAITQLEKDGFDSLFCGNNTAAEAATQALGNKFPILTYGDAGRIINCGVAGMTIPWDEMIEEAIQVYRRRRMGDASAARQHTLTPGLIKPKGWEK